VMLQSDNLTLAPASQLPFKDEWRRIASELPNGSVLFVVPPGETNIKQCMRCVALTLHRRGRRVAAVRSTVL